MPPYLRKQLVSYKNAFRLVGNWIAKNKGDVTKLQNSITYKRLLKRSELIALRVIANVSKANKRSLTAAEKAKYIEAFKSHFDSSIAGVTQYFHKDKTQDIVKLEEATGFLKIEKVRLLKGKRTYLKQVEFASENLIAGFISDVNKDIQERDGTKRFVWRTQEDERVRVSHRRLNRKVFSWDKLPKNADGIPIYPGIAIEFNCRCFAEPIEQKKKKPKTKEDKMVKESIDEITIGLGDPSEFRKMKARKVPPRAYKKPPEIKKAVKPAWLD